MDMLRISHAFISFLSLSYAIVVTTPRLKRDLQTDELNPGIKEGVLREALTGSDTSSKKQDCGATALRLNMDLNRLYGKWYPSQASDSAYLLWMSSLYGKPKATEEMGKPGCILMNLTAGPEEKTLNVDLVHNKKSIQVQGALLEDAFHPGMSKWVLSWPSGENTLTSIVATGSSREGEKYNWMLTVDCDLKGTAPPDWAIFSREEGLSDDEILTIKTLVDGIRGLRLEQTREGGSKNCDSE